jgi:ribosome biogenesis GTPase
LYTLEDLGWGPFFQQHSETTEDLVPARVAEEQRGAYVLLTERGPLDAAVAGRMMHDADGRQDYPAVGDWVLARPLPGEERAVIHRLLPRRTRLSRKTAGTEIAEQILVANVDTVFVVASLNQELNARRLERYLAAIWESGARPVVVLNKADLEQDRDALVREVESAVMAADVHVTSAVSGEGVAGIAAYIVPGKTAVFVGSSGVGKSSLVNRLLDRDAQAVREISFFDKGRHTTTSRQMLFVPGGGLIIDTPGLKVLGLWDAESGLGQAFADVEAYAALCAFNDCSHGSEPGCGVREALRDGLLERARFESYRKLQREQLFIESKRDYSIRNAQKQKWKQIAKANRKRARITER